MIKFENVTKIFGPHPAGIHKLIEAGLSQSEIHEQTRHVVAVRDVNLSIAPGEFFVVMGLSGSGKSTLIRCTTRLIEPTLGKILIGGQDVTAMNKKDLRELRRHKASMVFQRFGLFPHRRVIDNVAYGLEVRHTDRKTRHRKAQEVIEMVGLNGWEECYPHELSGGMQQRVGLARALSVDPEILLCDEPFSALDPLIRREMQDELIRLQKVVHKTVLFITHDFLEALKIGDRIAIMKNGEIVQIGTPAQIVAHPANEYVQEFTKDVPRIKVLTASTVMHPLDGVEDEGYDTVPGDMTLEALIQVLSSDDSPRFVVQDDAKVGFVDQHCIMQVLAREEA